MNETIKASISVDAKTHAATDGGSNNTPNNECLDGSCTIKEGHTFRVTFRDIIEPSMRWHYVSYTPLVHSADVMKQINDIICEVETNYREYVTVPETVEFHEMYMCEGLQVDILNMVHLNDPFYKVVSL